MGDLIEIIKNALKKRKVKLFIVFLLCSFFAWFISNLSESYTSNATFDLNFIGVPENRMLMSASKEKLDVQLHAVGFQFLRFNFKNKTVDIDLSKVDKSDGQYFVVQNQYQEQIEKQLASSMQLVQIVDDTLYFEFEEVITKEVPVEPIIEMTFKKNYLLDGNVKVEPAMLSITGPINELDSIMQLRTPKIELTNLTSDFSQTVFVVKPDSLFNSSFSGEKVTISGKVSRFSEKLINVPIQVLNLPKNMIIRTFPEEVGILCKAKMSDLKSIKSDDFEVIANYNEVAGNTKISKLSLTIQKKPMSVLDAILIQNQVDYILRKK